jgi:hypothetical protein
MHRFFPFALSATLLVGLNTVYADTLPQKDTGKTALHKDVAADSVSPADNGSGKPTTVIILDQDSLQALPNPYSNPGPRMISDAWAMRT